jgi:hypothetical protein
MKKSTGAYSVISIMFAVVTTCRLTLAQNTNKHDRIATDSIISSAGNKLRSPSVDETNKSIQQAVAMYDQKLYLPSRNLFEQILQDKGGSAYVCYYAALANRECGAEGRADELFQYITRTFPATPEAEFSRQVLSKIGVTSPPAIGGKSKSRSRDSALVSGDIGRHPFTATDIAAEGPNGVDQGSLPNCWFESGLAALAALPRGQAMIANVITTGKEGSYVVTFSDGSNYTVTEKNLKQCRDRALWARIIESAERQKYPDSKPDTGPGKLFRGSLEAGMGLVTGRPGEPSYPDKLSEEEVADFIYAAVKSQNPIVAGTRGENCPGIKNFVVPGHVYSIIDYDSSKHMIVLRNPWGSNPKHIKGDNDHLHLSFEAKERGVIRLSLGQFRKYFWVMSRSFI